MAGLDISLSFGLGVLSSLHCAQMCGPIVLSYSMAARGSSTGHLAYNGGRIVTYALLGAAAGAAGHALGRVGRLAGVEQTAAIVCGALLVIAGILMCGVVPRSELIRLDRIGVSSLFSRTVGRLMLASGAASKLLLGMLMGFLPCGLLYAALIKASSTGTAAAGAASMVAFGVGTSGTLLLLGLFSSVIGSRLGRWSNRLAAAGVILMGFVLLWRGMLAHIPRMSCHAGV